MTDRSDVTADAWAERVKAVVDQAHAEDWGGEHREGFCKACANAYIVAQHAVPGGPGTAPEGGLQRGIDALADAYSDITERGA